jgi:hypothetical protein
MLPRAVAFGHAVSTDPLFGVMKCDREAMLPEHPHFHFTRQYQTKA